MIYDNRVVAFIDILGFKSLLNETLDKNGNDNEPAIDSLISAYSTIRKIWDLDDETGSLSYAPATTKRVSIFSDCVVISFKVEQPSEVFFTLLEIKWLIMELLGKNIICRGAISLGKMIHTENYLFGPALVEAYMLESKAALYPRVILDSSIIDASLKDNLQYSKTTDAKIIVQSLLEQDSDGMFYIDYFYKAHSELNDPEYDFPSYIDNLGNLIRKGLMGSSQPSKSDIRIKYSWMRERFNQMVERVQSKDAIARLDASGDSTLANFYINLKKISPSKYRKFI